MSTLGAIPDATLLMKLAEMRKIEEQQRRETDKRKSTINPKGDADSVVLLNTYADLSTSERRCGQACSSILLF